MKCEKFNSRSLFNILEVKSCDKCQYYNQDQVVKIGNNILYIYYLNSCHQEEDDFLFNVKFLVLFNEIRKLKIKWMWFDSYYEFSTLFEVVDYLLDKYKVMIVIILK